MKKEYEFSTALSRLLVVCLNSSQDERTCFQSMKIWKDGLNARNEDWWLFLVISVMFLLIVVEFELGHHSITLSIVHFHIFVVRQSNHCLSHWNLIDDRFHHMFFTSKEWLSMIFFFFWNKKSNYCAANFLLSHKTRH